MKVIVAHPGKQHSYKTAEALYKSDMLFQYMTTVYDKRNWKILITKFLFPKSVVNKIKLRKSTILPDNLVTLKCTFLGLFLLFFYKLPINRKYRDFLFRYVHDQFGRYIAQYAIKNGVDAVIMYDTTCNECFKILKQCAPQIKRIQDVSIANRAFMKANYEKDIENIGDFRLKEEQINLWDPVIQKRNLEELELTEYFIVASNMSKRSLIYSKINENRIYVVPYGVDFDKFPYKGETTQSTKLHLIYVGQISFRKGLHHLLKLISTRFKDTCRLTIVGFYNTSNTIYQEYKDKENIKFVGFVDHKDLVDYYHSSDLFVFPTLGEGFGLVILEAMSSGLPCLVSDLAGGDDAIDEGRNGFVFRAGDDADFAYKLQWFVNNRNKLSEMSEYSSLYVKKYTWDTYYKNIQLIIKNILNEENI